LNQSHYFQYQRFGWNRALGNLGKLYKTISFLETNNPSRTVYLHIGDHDSVIRRMVSGSAKVWVNDLPLNRPRDECLCKYWVIHWYSFWNVVLHEEQNRLFCARSFQQQSACKFPLQRIIFQHVKDKPLCRYWVCKLLRDLDQNLTDLSVLLVNHMNLIRYCTEFW